MEFFGLRKNKCCLYEVNILFWIPWSSWWILLHRASCLLEMSIQESIWHFRRLFCMDVENWVERLRTRIVQNIWRSVYSWTDTITLTALSTPCFYFCAAGKDRKLWIAEHFWRNSQLYVSKCIRFFNFKSMEFLFDDFLICKWTFRQYITLDFETMTSLPERFTLIFNAVNTN